MKRIVVALFLLTHGFEAFKGLQVTLTVPNPKPRKFVPRLVGAA